MRTCEAIVLGCGAVGSAALRCLARSGARVVGLDRFAPPHGLGSSHGETRIIRKAYFEHPDYVPLLHESYRLWAEIEADGPPLFDRVGLLQVGKADGEVIAGVCRSAAEHGLAIERFTPGEAAATFPGFRFAEDRTAVFERDAGCLRVEDCLRTMLSQAVAAGAETRFDEPARRVVCLPDRVEVDTDRERYVAPWLIVAAGSWAAELLGDDAPPLRVVRKPVCWFRPTTADYERAPCFLYDLGERVFYGIPPRGGSGLKAAEHTGGEPVPDPAAVDRTFRPADEAPVRAFLETHLPAAAGPTIGHSVCLYTHSVDGHFYVDIPSARPRIVYAAGLSGHGFKFAPILGKLVSEPILHGTFRTPAGVFLRRSGRG